MIKNALEASEEYESIYVTIKTNDNQCSINISNSKVIPYKMQDKIFNKGYSTKGNGRGLGTYGSKLLINKYLNGNITFSSGKDIGTTFRIVLPKEV
jgi:sensor histidine kinase regulating citrate/malate metabolism